MEALSIKMSDLRQELTERSNYIELLDMESCGPLITWYKAVNNSRQAFQKDDAILFSEDYQEIMEHLKQLITTDDTVIRFTFAQTIPKCCARLFNIWGKHRPEQEALLTYQPPPIQEEKPPSRRPLFPPIQPSLQTKKGIFPQIQQPQTEKTTAATLKEDFEAMKDVFEEMEAENASLKHSVPTVANHAIIRMNALDKAKYDPDYIARIVQVFVALWESSIDKKCF